MAIAPHKNARTMAPIRAEIAASGACAATPGQRFDITEATVYKWKKRTRVHDVSLTQHSQQSTLARIVLGCADEMENKAVAVRQRVTPQTVSKWRARFVEHRLDGLLDAPRPGAPCSIDDARVDAVIARTLETVPQGATQWSTPTMAREMALSQTTVTRIWRSFGLQPHRQETFKLSSDPLFVDKVRDFVGLYRDPPLKAVVLWVDEKSQIALRRWIARNPYCRWLRAFPSAERTTTCVMAPRPCLRLWTSPPAK